ncbi:hypothetical protein ACD661_07240 [Legionella lytica]|uniref:Secreted protein n=1 Tax=Legionella lytica TaxID=96232 RepID=A0ABW8D913_9GAMM
MSKQRIHACLLTAFAMTALEFKLKFVLKRLARHCEEQSGEATKNYGAQNSGLLPFIRNDGNCSCQ